MVDEFKRAKSLAFKYLAYRNRSRHEIETHLAKKGISQKTVEETLGTLAKLNYVNDRDFARGWGRSRIASKKIGRRRLEQELLAKGVDSQLAGDTIDQLYAEVDEYELAKTCVEKRLARLKELPPEKKRRRLAQYLERKGFPGETVYKILQQLVPYNNG